MKYLAIILLVFAGASQASERHEHHVTNNYTTNTTSGTALGLAAANCNFDWATMRTQACVSGGYFDNQSAGNIGVGKRFTKDGPLFNGTLGVENDEIGVGVGINWRL